MSRLGCLRRLGCLGRLGRLRRLGCLGRGCLRCLSRLLGGLGVELANPLCQARRGIGVTQDGHMQLRVTGRDPLKHGGACCRVCHGVAREGLSRGRSRHGLEYHTPVPATERPGARARRRPHQGADCRPAIADWP